MSKTYYKKGDWNAICDICGFKFKASKLKKQWDGLMVCPQDFSPRHPQEFLRGKKDDQSVEWTRSEAADVEVDDSGFLALDSVPTGTFDNDL